MTEDEFYKYYFLCGLTTFLFAQGKINQEYKVIEQIIYFTSTKLI